MAWKEIYSEKGNYIAKVPSNSIYYSNPGLLKSMYNECRNEQQENGLMFGNGYLSYKNTGSHETLEINLYLIEKVFPSYNSSRCTLHFDYNKTTKMFDYYLVPSMSCEAMTNYVLEHIKFNKDNVQHVYASEIMDNPWNYIKKLLFEVQQVSYDYIKIYKNNTLEFEIEYVEDLENVKELATSLGYTFYLGDHDTCGKEIAILDDKSLNGYDNKIEFVSSPCGLERTGGDFEYVASIMGYKVDYGDHRLKFKSPKDMFSFIKDMLIQYHEVKTKLLSVRPQFQEYFLPKV